MLDQNACKAALTNFTTAKWPHRMDALMFSSALRQRLASTATRIVSINDLRKELSLVCHLNTSNLRVHAQEIVSILQRIVTSTKSLQEDLLPMVQDNHLPTQQEGIAPQNRTILLTEIEAPNKISLLAPSIDEVPHQPTLTTAPAPNKIILSAPPEDEVPNQPTPTTQLGALAPNKTMLSAPPADEAPNQPIQLGAPTPNKTMLLAPPADEVPNQPLLAVQLETPALLQQDLARVPKTLPASVPRGRPRGRDRGRPRCSRGQRQEHIDGSHSVGRGELMDWIVAANLMANVLNQNRRENEQRIARSGPLKRRRGR